MKQTKTPQKPAAQKPSPQPNCTTDSDERLAIAVDPDLKSAAVRRLRRIAGQVRGLESMVDQERYCADILVQIASVQEALRGVSRWSPPLKLVADSLYFECRKNAAG